MPLILKNKHDRFAFQFGASLAFRSTSKLVDQLQEQLRSAERERELAIVLRELAQVRLQLARFEAFANAPSPSPSLH